MACLAAVQHCFAVWLPACYLAVRVELLPTDFGTGSDDRSVHNGSVRPVFERSSPITQRGLS